jgi:hypothetical protein
MSEEKPLSEKQLAVIEDLFEGKQEQEILGKHNLSRKLYDKWLADETFNGYLDRLIKWEYRRSELILARKVRDAVSNLLSLTKSEQSETARKACFDIITMRANLLTGTCLAGTPAVPVDNPTPLPESPQLSPETAGKVLAVLAEEKTISTS